MALKKCKQCGNEVSTKATACSKCGANQKRRPGCSVYILAAVIVVFIIVVINSLQNDSANMVSPESKSPPASGKTPPAKLPSTASNADQQAIKPQGTTIPSDVSFTIIDSNTMPNIKRSLDVRLNKKVSEQTLRAIALNLKSQDSRHYDRTFIAYYLPGMAVGSGAWATTHFTPNLEVRILGLTAEDENALSTPPEPSSREVTGNWLDVRPYVGSRISIFREESKLFMEQTFKDGSNLKREIIERKSSLGRRFDLVDRSSAGDHWILGSDGNLQIRDNDGLIAIAKQIK